MNSLHISDSQRLESYIVSSAEVESVLIGRFLLIRCVSRFSALVYSTTKPSTDVKRFYKFN